MKATDPSNYVLRCSKRCPESNGETFPTEKPFANSWRGNLVVSPCYFCKAPKAVIHKDKPDVNMFLPRSYDQITLALAILSSAT